MTSNFQNHINSIFLPYEILIIIFEYDNRFAIRTGKIRTRFRINNNIYRNIIDVYSILSFAYYSRNDELEEDVVIELPINNNKIYLIQCCVYEENDVREVNKYLSIKDYDDEKILSIY
jgi:hypothetical protein